MRIMIVDDSSTMRSVIERALRQAGETDLEICESGEKALDSVELTAPDLILLDWHMEGLSGLDVLRILKSHARHRSIPVIMLTVEDHARSIQEAMDSGADGYMVKPLSAGKLKETLDAYRKSV
jgi:two-component system chemotaxis response regulator CheY